MSSRPGRRLKRASAADSTGERASRSKFALAFVVSAAISAALSGCVATVAAAPEERDGQGPAARFAEPSATAALPPLPSRGCRLPPAQRTRSERPGALERDLSSGERRRRFLLSLPAAGLPDAPAPLVLNLHGLFESPELQQIFSGMEPLALERGWAVAWPEGIGYSWNAGECCGRAKDEQLDDVRFLRDLVAQLGRELCLDLRRVYATGMSNGGFMSYRLACDASDVFAALAPVAAVETAHDCSPKRPVPILAFNGTSDPLVSYTGERFPHFTSVAETFARWRARNRCGKDGEHTLFERGDASCIAFDGCAAGGELISCTIDGGGHTWPGGLRVPFLGKTSASIDASRAILDFFAAHARP